MEVKAHEYLFQGHYYGDPRPPRKRRRREDLTVKTATDTAASAYRERKFYIKPFRYNFLHDLESLWWISAYLLMSRTLIYDEDEGEDPEENAKQDAEEQAVQRTSVRKLFTVGDERSWAMRSETGFYRELESLHPFMREMGIALDDARDALVRAYHYLEMDIDKRASEVHLELYEEMCRRYIKLAKRMEADGTRTDYLRMW